MNRLKEQINYSKFVETKSVILDLDYAERLLLELEEYHEKETPKKVYKYSRHKDLKLTYFCPICENIVEKQHKYCTECGQALEKWSDEDEDDN